MNHFLLGAIAMASAVAGLFFLRFWRETRDSLFLAFAISFFIEGANRSALALSDNPREGAPFFYLVRLLSFLLILLAVLEKNRSSRRASADPPPDTAAAGSPPLDSQLRAEDR
jgi:uncharacterized membrane protein HdeD (DUF308 family)